MRRKTNGQKGGALAPATARSDRSRSTTNLPRAAGSIEISARRRGPATVLGTLFQKGSAKVLLPRTLDPGLTAVLLNTAGGVTGGDRFETRATAAGDAHLTLTSQTAERAYRALPETVGCVSTHLRGAAGATLHWLPQETILFDGAALSRRLDVELASDTTLLAVEPVVLGRAAMGETVRNLSFSDQWRIRRNGELIYADALRLQGNAATLTGSRATLDGARACASLVMVSPDAERHLMPLRALMPETGGASVIRDGVLAARLIAADGFQLRRALIPILELLRGAALPRPWTM